MGHKHPGFFGRTVRDLGMNVLQNAISPPNWFRGAAKYAKNKHLGRFLKKQERFVKNNPETQELIEAAGKLGITGPHVDDVEGKKQYHDALEILNIGKRKATAGGKDVSMEEGLRAMGFNPLSKEQAQLLNNLVIERQHAVSALHDLLMKSIEEHHSAEEEKKFEEKFKEFKKHFAGLLRRLKENEDLFRKAEEQAKLMRKIQKK